MSTKKIETVVQPPCPHWMRKGFKETVNDHTAFHVNWMPFGGRDTSGEGMDGIRYSIKDVVRKELMVIKSGLLP